jgi:hypothetical protein
MVLPAPPDHMQPGPGHDPHGVRLAVPAGAGLLVQLARGRGPAGKAARHRGSKGRKVKAGGRRVN